MGSPAFVDALRLRRASVYGAGPGLDQALDVCRRLATFRIASTIGYSARPNDSPRVVTDIHLEAFDRLAAEDLDCYVSVKLSALQFDASLFSELVSAAAKSGRRLHLDALQPDTAATTLVLLEEAFKGASLGTTLPGRWRRSLEDSSRAVQIGLNLRVVKGQWTDRVGGSVDPTRGFLDVIDSLCGYQGGVAVATHDVKLLRESLDRLTISGTPCEVELFLGMPFSGPAKAARQYRVPIRIYVPYGNAWPGYGLKDLLTRPATGWWLIQDLLFGENKMWRSIRSSREEP
jgi:proline dehydrogenase